MSKVRNGSVWMGLSLALIASVVSQKVMFADGVHFFIHGAVGALPEYIDPRFLANILKNVPVELYYAAGGHDINTALALFSLASFLPAIWAVWLMRERVAKGEAGAAPVLMAMLAGVFLLINFPASELVICHIINCLLVHGYMSGRAKSAPVLHALAIVLMSTSYEISAAMNVVFIAWIAVNPIRRRDYRWHLVLHALGVAFVIDMVMTLGVNRNSASLISFKTVLSMAMVAAVIALAYALRRLWWVLLALCAFALVVVAAHWLPHGVFAVLGRLFRNFSYDSRGVTILITVATPFLLWMPALARARWPADWRQALDGLVVVWAAYQIASSVLWSMFWSDFKAAVAQQPPVVTYAQCSPCHEDSPAYRSGVFAGWSWTWNHMAAIASMELGLAERHVVLQDVAGFVPATAAEYEQVWTRFSKR